MIKKRRVTSAPRTTGRARAVQSGYERLLIAAQLQGQAQLVEMARNHTAAVLAALVEQSLAGTERAVAQVKKGLAAVEKAHEVILAAELAALEAGG